jgi:hypothetical protein
MEKESQNQDYSQYYNGNIPQYNQSGSIDFSQISSMFSRTTETMELVYQYAPQISQDVSYIFDFSNQGAYGVYIPSLVEEVKTNELRNRLESNGYEIKEENGMLVAYPSDEEKTNEQVETEIKQIWDQINAGKSEVLGVNMNKVKSATEQNMQKLVSEAEVAGITISNPSLLWDMLIMLELGATIVHEWEHSRGGDESSAQGREADFANRMMETIKQKYQMESGEEMPITAKGKNWYRFAQFMNYIPQSISRKPVGSDLSGRYGKPSNSESGIADWSMMAQQGESIPIENRLSRIFTWPLAPGLDQSKDTIEAQLRKQFESDHVPNTRMIYEELLSKDRDETAGYKTIEQLMEERRPQPLMVPLEKTASKLNKQATLFGWYNNLEISDGSTIPGLGDRVMAWDDRDEDFSREEDWIKQQPRYNPSYDLKGFYYRWIEPRFKPQLWDDITQDYTNTHPAKRFAQVENDVESDLPQILRILETIKDRILLGKMKATRIVATSDLYMLIKKVIACDGVNLKPFRFGRTIDGEFIYAIWVTDTSVPAETLRKAETRFQKEDASEDLDDLIEDLLGFSYYRSQAVEEIISAARSIVERVGIQDLYVVGMYAREKALGNESPDVEQLDFSSSSVRLNAQIGQLLANKMGVVPEIDNDLTFVYKGIKVEFSLTTRKEELARLSMLKRNKRNQIVVDLLRRDFTINMFAYNVVNGDIIDPLGVAKKAVRNSLIRTYFDPNGIIKKNPMVILRALKLKLQYGLEIERELEQAMIANSAKLFQGGFSKFDLLFARESIRSEGKKEADKLFDDFGLWKLRKIK